MFSNDASAKVAGLMNLLGVWREKQRALIGRGRWKGWLAPELPAQLKSQRASGDARLNRLKQRDEPIRKVAPFACRGRCYAATAPPSRRELSPEKAEVSVENLRSSTGRTFVMLPPVLRGLTLFSADMHRNSERAQAGPRSASGFAFHSADKRSHAGSARGA